METNYSKKLEKVQEKMLHYIENKLKEKMATCQKAVPAWIMPMNKVIVL